MKKVLITDEKNFYKANLHCHSTISDGRKTPEELKEFYKAHGYSAIAFTDHEAFITHNDLTDDSFVALNGYEVSVNDTKSRKTCHICLVALKPDNDLDIFYHRAKYFWGNAEKNRNKVHFDAGAPDFERSYSHGGVSDIMKRATEAGFFVTYNHPTWSLESYPEYSGYEGMNAMEIVNYGCVAEGYDDDNGHAYGDILNGGERIFCVATDDNHNHIPDDSPLSDSFGGYVMINAPRLGYTELTDALKNGNFYSSTGRSMYDGPRILSLEYDDGRITIKTSPVRSIDLITDNRTNKRASAFVGEIIDAAEFTLRDGVSWFRLVAVDDRGFKAYTNAYFVDTLKD